MSNSILFTKAKNYIPGGVNSPVRSFNAVGGTPFFTARAKDHYLYDVEGNQYIDYICSWGANIVGHANDYVCNKVNNAVINGLSYGTPTEMEVSFAHEITKLLPSIEKFRTVSSGTEATMTAIRLARGYTNKKYIIKFNGCYHGHSDSLLVKAGSGLATFKNPSSGGVPEEAVQHTFVLEYNNVEDLKAAFEKHPNEIACVILEPFAGNMNLVRPSSEFTQTLRRLCTEFKSVLIFDEVMTGFRVSLNCAQGLLGIKPDLTCLGKVIGGGMPLAGFGGRADIMDCLAPLGGVYQAGTLSGNPLSVAAGLANLELIQKPGFYEHLNSINSSLTKGLAASAAKHGIPFCSDYVGGMFGFYFCETIPQNMSEMSNGNAQVFNAFFHKMLKAGVYFAPSMYEAGFICATHDINAVNKTLELADTAFNEIANCHLSK
ncbi:MAG TPA: glutamate-1-semialdehyde 2,1-aminomutase [Aquella sp.]|nr:glutamate-1-semialdehyde 2,1-aminomutase [Aquella sp.]